MGNVMKLFYNVLMRIVAAFTASALGVIGAGAVAGISTAKAMMVAGITAVAAVVEKLARGFMDDGKLSLDEINAAFSAIDTNAKTAADLAVEARQSGQATIINPDGSVVKAAQGQGATPLPADVAAKAEDPSYN